MFLLSLNLLVKLIAQIRQKMSLRATKTTGPFGTPLPHSSPFPPIYIIEVTCAHSLCDIALVWIWHFSAVSLLHIAIAFSIIARVYLSVSVHPTIFVGRSPSTGCVWILLMAAILPSVCVPTAGPNLINPQ